MTGTARPLALARASEIETFAFHNADHQTRQIRWPGARLPRGRGPARVLVGTDVGMGVGLDPPRSAAGLTRTTASYTRGASVTHLLPTFRPGFVL
jgi:hypothetical protein